MKRLSFKKRILLLLFLPLLCLGTMKVKAQNAQEERNKHFYFEAGATYYHFRDEIASSLAYSGLGGGHLGLGYHTSHNGSLHQDINLFFEYGEASLPQVANEIYTEVYRLAAIYSLYVQKPLAHQPLALTYGATLSADALYIVYPFLFGNNSDAYSVDLLSIGPNAGLVYTRNNSIIRLTCNLDVLHWNVRPQAFNGISPDAFFSERKITNLSNNIKATFKTAYAFSLASGNRIELAYVWNFRRNTSTINTLSYAQHNLNFRFSLCKTKSHEK